MQARDSGNTGRAPAADRPASLPEPTHAVQERLRQAGVTRREAQVLLLLPEELSNAEIAGRLSISERTVESHVSSLLRKLGVSARGELVAMVRSWRGAVALRAGAWHAPDLIGRASELDAVSRLLAEATRHGFRCALVLGEPGVGKTRLVTEFLGRQTRTVCLAARAFPLGATTSLALWCDAIDAYLRPLPAAEVRRLCSPWLDQLAAFLPTAAETLGAAPADPPGLRTVVDLIGRLLHRLAVAQAVTVVFDDSHLADESSWEALELLARDLSDSPILVVLTARPGELADHPLAGHVVRRLEDDGVLHRLALTPLGPVDVARLASGILGRQTVPAPLVDWLMARSLGNPLYAASLVQALVDEQADLEHPELQTLPESLGERVLAQLRGLDRPAVEILELLAVISRVVPASELASISDNSLDRLVDPLEQLADAGLLTEREDGHDLAYEAAHPLVAEAVYQRMSGARRRVLHRRVADHLRSRGRLAEAASHLARGADRGDPEAVATLGEALRDAGEREAYREALAILGTLVDVLPRGDPRWLEVLDALSHEDQWVLDHRADIDTLPGIKAMQAMDAVLADSPDLVRRGIIKLRLASLCSYGTGDLAEAEPPAREALALFEEAGDRPHALLAEVELAAQRLVAGDLDGVQAVAGRLLDQADALGEPTLLMHVAGWLAVGRYFAGDFEEAETLFRRSASIATRRGQVFHRSWSLSLLTVSQALAGNMDATGPLLDEARPVGRRSEESLFHECATVVHWAGGNFGAALSELDTVLHWHGARLPKRRGFALPFGAVAAAELGRTEVAEGHLRTARQIYATDFAFYRDFTRWADAVVTGLAGHPAEALDPARRSAGRMIDTGCRAYAPFFLVDMAELASDAGDVKAYRWAVEQLETSAATLGNPLQQAFLRLAAAAHPEPSDSQTGAAAAAEAARACAALGYHGHAGRAWHRAGCALSSEAPDDARAALGRAADAFERCGATVRRDRVLAQLSL